MASATLICRLPAEAWLPAARALDDEQALRIIAARGRPAARKGAVRRVAQVAVGGLAAAVLAVFVAELARTWTDPQIRKIAPHLTFTGLNDLGPLRQRLASAEDAPPNDMTRETS
ncbi:hypothetical protein [Phenylobacterium sp.]|uniref:hypothetical protein n=1 Tax=Phenylobacterium sp. TaxID=1871053 RepID=UPI0035B02759